MSLPLNTQTLEQRYIDLASRRLGGQTLACSDDFFAGMENLLERGRGVFIDDKFTERGKWMDGWESRRRRFLPDGTSSDGLEHDWCIIKLGAQGTIKGINVDTNHFMGNAPQYVSLEACASDTDPDEKTQWTEVIAKTQVFPNNENLLDVPRHPENIDEETPATDAVWTHVRFNIYPDGGVARLRVYGEVKPDHKRFVDNELIDLAAIRNGGLALLCSDMFFSHMQNLLMPERGINMGDGWETKRRRMTGDPDVDRACDWLILKLADTGMIKKVLVDTRHFKGNYAHSFALEACRLTAEQAMNYEALRLDAEHSARLELQTASGAADAADAESRSELSADMDWHTLIPRTILGADREHIFVDELAHTEQTFSHVRLRIYPDGGVSRLRLWGTIQS